MSSFSAPAVSRQVEFIVMCTSTVSTIEILLAVAILKHPDTAQNISYISHNKLTQIAHFLQYSTHKIPHFIPMKWKKKPAKKLNYWLNNMDMSKSKWDDFWDVHRGTMITGYQALYGNSFGLNKISIIIRLKIICPLITVFLFSQGV